MRSGSHIPQRTRILRQLWWCVGFGLMLTTGCGLQGFECQTQQDCGNAQVCNKGWCRQAAPPLPTDCTPGVSRRCPTSPSIFPICTHGTQRCSQLGKWGSCEGVVLGQPETCNRVDDNCNGEIDEGLDCGCSAGAKRTCQSNTPTTGRCQPGFQRCAADRQWGTCEQEIKPRVETCNGADDDCDGKSDEGADNQPLQRSCYPGPSNSAGKGICKAGKQQCDNGTWSACLGHTLPTPELCNGLDDDCNGGIDEPCEPCAPNTLVGHIGAPYDHTVDQVAWSPDGKYLIAAANSGTLQIWEYPQNKYLRSISTGGPLHPDSTLVISQNSRYVAVARNNHDIEVWTLPHGTRYATFRGHSEPIASMAFHPSGDYLVSLSTDTHELRIWTLQTGKLHTRIVTNALYPWDHIALSPSGKRLVTTSRKHALLGIWEFAAPRHSQLFEGCNTGHLAAMFRNTDEVVTLCQGDERTKARIQRWSLSQGTQSASKSLTLNHITNATLHVLPRNRAAVLGTPTTSQLPTLVDIDSGVVLQEFDLPRQRPGTSALRHSTLSPNGDFLLSSSGHTRLWLWRVGDREPAGALHHELERHQSAIHSLTVHPKGHLLATSSLQEQAIRLWDIQPGTPTFGKQAGALYSASGAGGILAFSPDGKWLASTDIYNQIVLWDLEARSVHATLSKHGSPITQLLFSPNGRELVSVSRKGQTAILWAVPEGRFVRYVSHQPLSTIAFHPGGKLLAIGLKQHIELIAIAAPELPPKASFRMSNPESLLWMLFHPKGDALLFADDNVQSWAWGTASNATPLSKLLPGELHALHPAGSLLTVSSDKRGLVFLKPLTGAQVGQLELQPDTPDLSGVAFGYAPHQLITTHANGWIKAWDCSNEGQP